MAPPKYKSPIFLTNIEALFTRLRNEGNFHFADRIEAAARHDYHDLRHDGEFHEGCEHCDKEREKYG